MEERMVDSDEEGTLDRIREQVEIARKALQAFEQITSPPVIRATVGKHAKSPKLIRVTSHGKTIVEIQCEDEAARERALMHLEFHLKPASWEVWDDSRHKELAAFAAAKFKIEVVE